jgi:hypothetical protein
VKGGTPLHATLALTFDPVSLQYAVSLEHAETILLGAGWLP